MEPQGSLLLLPEESVRYSSELVSFSVINEEEARTDYGKGEFFLTNKRVVFRNTKGSWELPHNEVALHAVSRDPHNFGAPCLYVVPTEEESQMLYTPEDPTTLDEIYQVFSKCAEETPQEPCQET